MLIKEVSDGIYKIKDKIYTKNLRNGLEPVYGENIITIDGIEYREWNPYRSKFCAAIKKGLKTIPIKRGTSVLYLGASEGTTPSHVSDIVRDEGIVYCVDIAQKVFDKLLKVTENRENMIPIFGDARIPDSYEDMILEKVDVIYQDVAQPDQNEILIKNAKKFLKEKGYALLCLKTRSVDVTKTPEEILEESKKELSKYFDIVEVVNIEPYEKDHYFLVLKYCKK